MNKLDDDDVPFKAKEVYNQLKEAYSINHLKKFKTIVQSQGLKQNSRLIRRVFHLYILDDKDPNFLNLFIEYLNPSPKLKEGLMVEAVLYDEVEIIKFFIGDGDIDPSLGDLLYCACELSAEKTARYLFDHYKRFFMLDNPMRGMSTARNAISVFFSDLGHEMINFLESHNIDLFDPKQWKSPFHFLELWSIGFISEDLKFIEMLHKKGAGVNDVVDPELNLTPIHLAIFETSMSSLEYLVSHKANLNYLNGTKKEVGFFSPLSAVAVEGCRDVVDADFLYRATKLFVQNGADPEFKDEDGDTAESVMLADFKKKLEEVLNDQNIEEEETRQLLANEIKESIENAQNAFNKGIQDGLAARALKN